MELMWTAGANRDIVHLIRTQLGKPVRWYVAHQCVTFAASFAEARWGKLKIRTCFQKVLANLYQTVINFRQWTSYQVILNLDNFPNMENIDLSTGQQYLYNIWRGVVASGNCCSDFALRKPGPVCHSRWLTTANRLLCLFVATKIYWNSCYIRYVRMWWKSTHPSGFISRQNRHALKVQDILENDKIF